MKNNIKKYAVIALVAVNIFIAGGVFGALKGYDYAKGQAHGTQQAVQAALKTVTVAQASK